MGAQGRILVVDDDPITRDMIATALRGQGYEEAGVGRFADAVEAVRALRPHVILSDMVLPDGSGLDLAQALRDELPIAALPSVILMSAFSRNRLADQRALKDQAGAAAFLVKPFQMPAMLDLVARELALKKASGLPEPTAPREPTSAPKPSRAEPTEHGGGPRKGSAPPTMDDPFATGVTADLPSVLATAWRKGWTGTLLVTRPGRPKPIEKRIIVEQGQVIWATTTLMEERLGRVLLRLGLLPRDQYEPTLREAARSRRRYGEVLVGAGLLAPWQLEDALLQQMEGIVIGALGWPEETYDIVARTARLETSMRLAVSPVPRLVVRAFRSAIGGERIDERLAAAAGQGIGRGDGLPDGAFESLAPTLEEQALLKGLDRPTTLDALLALHPDGVEAARPLVAALLALGMASSASRPPESASRPPAPRPARTVARRAGPKQAPEALDHGGSPDVDPRLLEAEAAFEAGRQAVARNELDTAAHAFHRAVALCPDEGEYLAWAAWVQALSARAAFDRALDVVGETLESAVGLTPSANSTYGIVEKVIRLRMLSSADEWK